MVQKSRLVGAADTLPNTTNAGRNSNADFAKHDSRSFGAKSREPQKPQAPTRGNAPSPGGYSSSPLATPNIGAGPPSPSLGATLTPNEQMHRDAIAQKKVPIFFREEYSAFIVKGNFMTLAAKPHLVEEGEWLAHQIVEQNRLLSGMLRCVQQEDKVHGRPSCNQESCPTMSAGVTTYTWIDTERRPINLPAPVYIKHIQTWVGGKIQDFKLFPTETFTQAPPLPRSYEMQADPNSWLGKSSGFPERFEAEIKNMYKQMFRCYAHLYWQHWLTFWDTSSHRELNTCFVHFMNVGRSYNLLSDKEIEPMAPLLELWVKQGVLPKIEKPLESAEGAGTAPKSGGPATTAGASAAETPSSAAPAY